jgi:hypothetical protein
MSLHNLAKKVQGTGRGQDSMLVHMSPREVQGLQALAKVKGGQLTTNPKTGLPEAGFLEDILPMVAAGAAMYFTAGAAAPALAGAFGSAAPFVAGAGAGALIGGGSAAIQGGDVGQGALIGGIGGLASAGMGAMMGPAPVPGAESLGGAIAPTGADVATAGAATGQGATVNAPVVSQAGVNGAMPPPAAPQMPPPAAPQSPYTPTQLDTIARGQGVFPEGSAALPGSEVTGNASLPPIKPASTSTTDLGKWWDQQSPWEKAGYSTLGAGLAAGLNAPPSDNGAPDDDYTSPLKRISPNFRAQEPIRPNPYYRAQYPTYTKRAAEGGLMAAYQNGGPVERMTQQNTAMNPQGGLYPQGMIDKTQYATPTQRPTSLEVVESEPSYEARVNPMMGTLMAGGGLADLGGYSDGGRLLKGPGDGMSDNIPAQIGSKQPARLADGEFVVPADVVSHLGNGSTDAGAKRLYSMMDKVRTARTGKKKQAPAVNTNKLLPA